PRGRAFPVGLDLKEMTAGDLTSEGAGGSEASRRLAGYRSLKRWQRAFTAVADCPKPVIAAVHGYCIGGGIDLISACDIRLAAAAALFSGGETKIAIVADLGTLQRLPALLARGQVRRVACTGQGST